ncbi:zinc finger, CCHC-type containing protein [Tanacetum coccineum]|uniref:Zinc finger, CCHC-type containing protein n=1 Tax=Tanacetum coccineum TaxID=301880 RepID=A0ABQ5J0X0_9ASTR
MLTHAGDPLFKRNLSAGGCHELSRNRTSADVPSSKDASVGIINETTTPYTSQQNGISERKNKVLKEMVNSMLSYLGLSQGFWGEALLTTCYLLNRVPNKKNRITPYELWTKRKPNLNYLRVWGFRVVVRLPDPKIKTLGERGIECIFVGYAEHSKASRFFVIEPDESVSINSIIESKDAIFDKNRFSSNPIPNLKIPNGTEDIGGSVVLEEVTEEDDPKTFNEAMKFQDVAIWKEAINDEMDSIMGNNTWVLADLPPGCKPLGCKWIFKRKLKVDGTIEKFKARLVIQGFIQKSRIYYFDTYALVARISTIRLMIAMASIHNLIIHQMDVKTTFLNGELEEEVDLTKEFLSSRFSLKDMGETNVIIGIRIKHESNGIAISQSHYIEKVLKKFNYFDCTPVSTPMDTSEKLMPNNSQAVSQLEYSRVIGCLIYTMTCRRPDIAFAIGKLSRYTSNPGTQHWQASQRVLKYLKKTMDYRLTYTGYPSVLEGYTDASWISNTEENSSTSGRVFLLGGGAISWAFKKQTCITGLIMESEFVVLAAAGKEAKDRDALCILKVSGMTDAFSGKPQERYVYTSNPGTQHWQAIQWILKYLKKTIDYRLTYTGYPLVLEGYTDAFKKQTCITGSTMESEFVALAAAGKEAEWLKNLLLEIPLWSKPLAPISIGCVSAATLTKAYSQMYNGKSRHLGVIHSMIREMITNEVIYIEFVRSQQNLADHLTKGLARDLVIKSAEGIGLKSN